MNHKLENNDFTYKKQFLIQFLIIFAIIKGYDLLKQHGHPHRYHTQFCAGLPCDAHPLTKVRKEAFIDQYPQTEKAYLHSSQAANNGLKEKLIENITIR